MVGLLFPAVWTVHFFSLDSGMIKNGLLAFVGVKNSRSYKWWHLVRRNPGISLQIIHLCSGEYQF